jgi:hypothetical protein
MQNGGFSLHSGNRSRLETELYEDRVIIREPFTHSSGVLNKDSKYTWLIIYVGDRATDVFGPLKHDLELTEELARRAWDCWRRGCGCSDGPPIPQDIVAEVP